MDDCGIKPLYSPQIMRRIYIHQQEGWPQFTWDIATISYMLAKTRYKQGRLLGQMESLGFSLQSEAALQTLTLDVVKSSEIEGELLPAEQVRSSIARKLGMDIAGLVASDRKVEGTVEMMLDATLNFKSSLNRERLFGWHACLFPGGRSGMHTIEVGAWRTNAPDDPMQVISGAMGKQRIHFEAPAASLLEKEMQRFIKWFNEVNDMDDVLKSAVAHLWFVTVHPFDDGNGRIARALTDLQLCRADRNAQRFYSMSTQIRKERQAYYNILEKTTLLTG